MRQPIKEESEEEDNPEEDEIDSEQDEEEERVELAKISMSTIKQILDDLQSSAQGAYSSAACAVAIPTPVSLSESEVEEDTLAAIADSFTAPQWTDNLHEALPTNTLTVLTLAGVPVINTSIDLSGIRN